MALVTSSQGLPRWIVRLAIMLVFLIPAMFVGCASCTLVEPGHVGIKINRTGSSRGVQNSPIVSGYVAFNPLTEAVIEFPTTVQNVVWTQSRTEGSVNDDSLTFTSVEGVTVNADVGLAYHIDADRAPRLYARFRETNLDNLSHGFVRNMVRDALNEAASRMPIQDIYGAGKTRLLQDSLAQVRGRLSQDGFVVDQLTFVSALRLPPNVVEAINRAIEATQQAVQAENRVRQIRAEADQNIAAARGRAEAARLGAQGDADALLTRTRADAEAIILRAQAEARANEVIRLSTSPEVLRYRLIERWNGIMPAVASGGGMPLLTMDMGAALGGMSETDRRARLQALLGQSAAPSGASTPSAPISAGAASAPAAPSAPAQ